MSMNFRYLTADEIDEIVQAAAQAGFANDAMRANLIAALNQGFALGLNIVGQPLLQLNSDLNAMNFVEQLADGSVPLLDWLRQAGRLARQLTRPQAAVFGKFETKVDAKASGQPPLPDPTTLREVVNNEDIVHQDDMVDYWFLSAGALAGESVAKLLVTRYEGGNAVVVSGRPRRSFGTGWLITRELVVTNHHVVNARLQGEPAADHGDLLKQGENTVVKFDFNSADDAGEDVAAARLEAWDTQLDYAVLRLSQPSTRRPLRLQRHPVVYSPGTYMPVNIIQHPSGNPKRVAFRNNLITSADATTVRYFTDTMSGSSGSPVFDDAWQVVALHRGSRQVEGVSFQGRGVAVVNVGTQITSILDHLAQNFSAVRQEIVTD